MGVLVSQNVLQRSLININQDNKRANRAGSKGWDSPAAHHLNEACVLQLQKDVWDDISSAQHTLQAMRLQGAVQFWQEGEYMVDKPDTKKAVVTLRRK